MCLLPFSFMCVLCVECCQYTCAVQCNDVCEGVLAHLVHFYYTNFVCRVLFVHMCCSLLWRMRVCVCI